MFNSNVYQNRSRTNTFSDLWPTTNSFVNDFRSSDLNESGVTNDTLTMVYAELYAKYGDSNFKSTNDIRNKLKVFSILKNEGLIFQKRLQIQNTIVNLSISDLTDDGSSINNYAENPGDEATTTIDELDFLKYVSSQSVNKGKKGKLQAYRDQLYSIKDVTTQFIEKFKVCFETILWSSLLPPVCVNEEVEETDEEE